MVQRFGYFVGVDIGKTNIRIASSDGTAQVAGLTKRPYRKEVGSDLFDEIVEGIDELLQQLGADRMCLRAVGVAVPAVVDQTAGRVVWGPAFDFLKDDSISTRLEDLLQVPVAVDTDSTTATVGELWAGYGGQHDKLAVITWGTGIGAGLILDGEVYRDGDLFAEFGHMIVSDDQQRCICGSTGCIGAMVSGPAIERQAKSLMRQNPDSLLNELAHQNVDGMTSFLLFEAARQGEPLALQLLERVGVLFGRLCANLVYTIQPERIVFVGGLSSQLDMIFDSMNKTMRENCWFLARQLTQCDIVASELKDTAGVLGAIRLAQLKESAK